MSAAQRALSAVPQAQVRQCRRNSLKRVPAMAGFACLVALGTEADLSKCPPFLHFLFALSQARPSTNETIAWSTMAVRKMMPLNRPAADPTKTK
jgi:hypothetical protein